MIKTRRIRWVEYVLRNAYSVLVGKSEGKRPLGESRRRWYGNIKIDLKEIG